VSDVEFKQVLLDDFVAVEMIDVNPDRIKLPDWNRTLRGKVIGVGPGKMLTTGDRGPMGVKVGDVVSFPATAGMDCSFGVSSRVRMMKDPDIDAVIEEAA
jgi:co-chaperonin GroES (HSP10)